MNRDAKKVRKAIMQRKKMRGITPKNRSYTTKQFISPLPTDEEKHGYYPNIFDGIGQGNQKSELISGMILKGTLSIILFFGIGIMWQLDSAMLEKPKQWTSNALTEEFPFANVYHWYNQTFGSPMAFSPTNTANGEMQSLVLPVIGSVTESFQANGTGIKIAPTEKSPVTALSGGVVIFAGKTNETQRTITVQHTDGSESTYGNLSSIDVHLYQPVQANQIIGEFSPTTENETVYFSIEKDNQYIDPIQVIEVDDNP
ncbi:M23 family metallopeptidase [Ornithinibacillus halophilus]|uniref:Stage IV sporulation protein FA n=1 Tax=Ornithinibacillus halophilus TaxID=930117 RepID=A0A1M5DEL7_9BACI|nr:M23 family metallopeptidase [Ornithinibacillus halophilus]SHF65518.1 stage IV sporulation protein FA [Ornithinibacillus halophilus]